MKIKEPKNIKPLTAEKLRDLTKKMREAINALDPATLHVKIQDGNRKTGAKVGTISLLPLITCKNCAFCSKYCYDLRNDLIYTSVITGRAKNVALFNAEPARYFLEITKQIDRKGIKFLRWNVGGDIPNDSYLYGMIGTALATPGCKHLAFTKNYELINAFLDRHDLPANLQIIFSGWPGNEIPNPHHRPTSHPRFADGTTSADPARPLQECTGDCSVCAEFGERCWTLKNDEQVIFNLH